MFNKFKFFIFKYIMFLKNKKKFKSLVFECFHLIWSKLINFNLKIERESIIE